MTIALGTANWGSTYGVSGTRIEQVEAHLLLDDLTTAGYSLVDTALYYGKAHEYLETYPALSNLSISTKIPGRIEARIVNTILRSKIKFDKILLHSVPDDPGTAAEIHKVFPGRLGISLNSLEDFPWVEENSKYLSRVQLPFSCLDRRWEKFFNFFEDENIEIQVRSIFLQGILLTEELDNFDFPLTVKNHFRVWRRDATLVERVSQCVSFAKNFPLIQSQVLGCDSLEQLRELRIADQHEQISRFPNFKVTNEKVLLPMNWKR